MVSLVPVSGTVEQRVGQIAYWQRGRVARRQLLAAGISSSAIGRLVARGGLVVERPGVYVAGHQAAIKWGRETSALLAVRTRAAISHGSSARLQEMLSGDLRAPIELTVLGAGAPAMPGVVVHRSRLLTEADLIVRDGLPITGPAWTILDIATSLSDRGLERAVERALDAHLVRLDALRRLLDRCPARRGSARLARVLAAGSIGATLTRSEAEERLLALVRDADLPLPRLNQPLIGYEVDVLWPAAGLIVEVDGYRYHSSRRAFESDRRRDARLHAAGYVVLRFSARQLVQEPLFVIAMIAQALGAAGPGTPPAGAGSA